MKVLKNLVSNLLLTIRRLAQAGLSKVLPLFVWEISKDEIPKDEIWIRKLFRVIFVTNWGAQFVAFLFFVFVDSLVFQGGLSREITALSSKWSQVRIESDNTKIGRNFTDEIAIIDISTLRKESLVSDNRLLDFDSREGFTRREPLRKIVESFQNFAPDLKNPQSLIRPRCVALDIDFSPDPNLHTGRAPMGHLQFVEQCLKGFKNEEVTNDDQDLHNLCRKPVFKNLVNELPVFLGVGRMVSSHDRMFWLGTPEYSHMAAGIFLLSENQIAGPRAFTAIPQYTSVRRKDRSDGKDCAAQHSILSSPACILHNPEIPESDPKVMNYCSLPSLSSVMSAAYQFSGTGLEELGHTSLFRRIFTKRTFEINLTSFDSPSWGTAECYILNESYIKDLKDVTFQAEDYLDFVIGKKIADSNKWAKILNDKAVFIGDADAEHTTDLLNLASISSPVPGVYVHAAGFLSLIESQPLVMFKWYAEFLVSLFAAYSAYFLILGLKNSGFITRVADTRIEILCIFVTVFFAVCLVSLFGGQHIIWKGSLACIFGAFLEGLASIYYKAR
ncbi:MAG: hypothetical protein AAF546_04975 [Verrucomicrobiota bacterium]